MYLKGKARPLALRKLRRLHAAAWKVVFLTAPAFKVSNFRSPGCAALCDLN